MATTNDQAARLHTFLSCEYFQKRRDSITMESLPLIIRTQYDDPWGLSTDEVEAILHQYAPELSATVSGPTIVIFHEKDTND